MVGEDVVGVADEGTGVGVIASLVFSRLSTVGESALDGAGGLLIE